MIQSLSGRKGLTVLWDMAEVRLAFEDLVEGMKERFSGFLFGDEAGGAGT